MIYIAQFEKGPVKIGCTHGPIRARLRELEREFRRRVTLLAVLEGDRKMERTLHERFAHLRLGQQEQFRLDSDLIRFIFRHGFNTARMKKGRQRFRSIDEPARLQDL